MSAFLTDLVTRIERPGNHSRNRYWLTAPLVYQSDILGRIDVPVDFCTDFASIPRPVWLYIDPEDACICYPSVVHDYLYTQQPCARDVADKVLREAMQICGARIDQRFVVFNAVRQFGGSHWKTI